MGAIAFGPRARADRMTRRVRAMHRSVHGSLEHAVGSYPAGTPYRADDPELLLWVLFTLVDSALVVYGTYVRPLSRVQEAELWADYRVIGRLFGAADSDMPAGIEALDEYRHDMLHWPTGCW